MSTLILNTAPVLVSGHAAAAATTSLAGSPAPGRLWIVPADGSHARIEVWVDAPFVPTGAGFGGWTTVPRDGQVAVTEYTGTDPERWTGTIRVDGWSDNLDQQATWEGLLAMASEISGKPPGPVLLKGTVAHEVSSRQWLIETITPGIAPLFDTGNRLLGHTAVLGLLLPVIETAVTSPIKQAQAAAKKTARTVTARTGDTLLTIAKRELGDAAKWKLIAAINLRDGHPIRDPNHIHAGDKIKIP